jgi:carboxylesterase
MHGFGGTPLEVKLVADVASELGLGARAPLLPGHGRSVRELVGTRFEHWLAAADEHYRELAARGPVVLAGLSMGSLVAMRLALRYPETSIGLIVLANAVWLMSPWPLWGLRLVERLRLPDFSVPKPASDIDDEAERRQHLTYNAQPVHSAISVMQAGRRLLPELERLRCPALILHGRRDRVCPVANAWRLAVRLGSVDKRVVLLPRSHHVVTRDVERAIVRDEVHGFLQRYAPSPVDP